MADELTIDPDVVIEERGHHGDREPYIVYRSLANGQRWEVSGECNQCGQCWEGCDDPTIGWTGSPIGEPGAFIDLREPPVLDCPVRPELKQDCPACVLVGVYL